MTTELKDGHVLSLSSVKSGGLQYKGKPVTLELDNEKTQSYKGTATFTDEEKKLGNQDAVIIFNLDNPIGTIKIHNALKDGKEDDEFEGLTDAEKYTKQNSIQYQTGMPEVTQIADGSQATHIGVEALASRKKDEESKSNKINKKYEDPKKVENTEPATTTASNTTNKPTVSTSTSTTEQTKKSN